MPLKLFALPPMPWPRWTTATALVRGPRRRKARLGVRGFAAGWGLLLLLNLPAVSIGQESLERLGAGSYAQRQAATWELWNERESMRADVERATRHPDPEIASRALWILQRWERGLLPDTPPEVLRLLAGRDGVARLEGLLDAGLFSAVTVAIEQAGATAEGPQLRSELSESLERRFPFYVRKAVEENRLDAFCALLEVACETPAVAVARAQLLKRLGFDLQQRGELPQSAERWSQAERDRTRVLIEATLGDVEKALRTAQETGQADMVRACHVLLGNWQDLLDRSLSLARDVSPGSYEATSHWSDVLIAAKRLPPSAAVQEICDEAVAALAGAPRANESSNSIELRWRCLMIHGYLTPALEILRERDPAEAAEVISYTGDFHEAFAVLGFDRQRIDAQVAEALDAYQVEMEGVNDRTQQKPRAASGDRVRLLEKLLAVSRLLLRTGQDIQARRLYQAIAALPDHLPGRDSMQRFERREVVRSLWQNRRPDWAFELASLDGRQSIEPMVLSDLLRGIGGYDDAETRTLAILWGTMARLYSEATVSQRLEWLYQLYQGDDPWKNDPERSPDALYEELRFDRPGARQINQRIALSARGVSTASLGDFFLRLGRIELAREIYESMAASDDEGALNLRSEAELRLARLALSAGRAEEAYNLYRKIWLRHSGPAAERHPINTAEDDLLVTLKAVHGELVVLERRGDQAGAERRLQELRWMLSCTPASVAKTFIDYLREQQRDPLALEVIRPLLRYTAFGGDRTLDFGRIASLYGDLLESSQPRQAARWNELALAGTLETMSYYARGYVLLPAENHALRAVAAARDGDAEEVDRQLQAALRFYPLNINLAEDTLREVRKAGFADRADAVLDQVLELGIEHLRAFPRHAEIANNLAWVAALGRYRLDDALELSQRACYWQPDSTTYRDTLAEVLFQQGETAQALTVEQHCLLDDPAQWHLHQQIERFQRGDPTIDVPES